MKLLFLGICATIILFAIVGFSQHSDKRTSNNDSLSPMDETESWQYPFQAPEEKRKKLLGALSEFKDPMPVSDLFRELGKPDRIDDLRKESKPLSPYESGFMAGSKDRFSYRCIWFARKASKSPGLSDSWLAAYVDKDGKTISIIHNNWLKE